MPVLGKDGDWSQRGADTSPLDLVVLLGIALSMLVARHFLITAFFRPWAIKLSGFTTEEDIKKKENVAALTKMCKYLWHGLAYLVMWLWALYLYVPQPCAFGVEQVWVGYPHDPAGKTIFKGIFMVEAAWYALP